MKKVPIGVVNGKEWFLNIPENYERKPLPYFNEWVDALESGNYIQGKECLCNDLDSKGNKCYCCLGVLSDVQNLLVDGRDCQVSPHFLCSKNPNYPFLGQDGNFYPLYVSREDGRMISLLSQMNDSGFCDFPTFFLCSSTYFS